MTTDLSDPAIREAGARALADMYSDSDQEWDSRDEAIKGRWRSDWMQLAAEVDPIIQQAEIREQMRGGIDDAGTETP